VGKEIERVSHFLFSIFRFPNLTIRKNKALALPVGYNYLCANFILMNIRQMIDILSIILPAFIVLLGILRLFVSKTKAINSISMLLAIILLVLGLVRYFILGSGGGSSSSKGPKPVPLNVSKHSPQFNTSFESILAAYFNLNNGFIKNDTVIIHQSSVDLLSALDSFKIEELKADTLIYQTALQPFENIKTETGSLLAAADMENKKVKFNLLSNELFSLVNTARYDVAKLYWLECGAAFGEDKQGNWFSKTEQSVNPYGKADCAEVKATVDFVLTDTTKKQ
jgi:hypothetical protein